MISEFGSKIYPEKASIDDSQEFESLTIKSPKGVNEVTPTIGGSDSSSITPILLEWSNVKYSIIKRPSRNEVKKVPILNGVTGYANPGELLVLMGSSGAGKTTLLNLLCNRISSVGEVEFEGQIKANGTSIKDLSFTDYVGYVTQEDVMMSTMTCRETLEFAANLKVRGSQSYRREIVSKMIEHLGLNKAADTVIGSQIVKGISGGERKRVAIGLELISDPSILFLDEPTSGLDSFTAELIVNLLRTEAQKGRTVITTLHQPSFNMFKNFQKLILMFEGLIVYQGPAKNSRHYFADLSYVTPALINPPDYYMEILHIKSRENKTTEELERLKHLSEAYESNKDLFYAPKSILYLEISDLPSLESLERKSRSSWLHQFKWNVIRNFKQAVRDPLMYTVLFIQSIGLIVMFDIIWHDTDTSYQGVGSRTGYLYLSMFNQMFQCMIPFALTCNYYIVPVDKTLYFKEQASGLYDLSPYFLAKQLATIPVHTVLPLLNSVGLYWAVDLDNEPDKFFIYCKIYSALIMMLCSFTGGSYGILSGILFSSQIISAAASNILMIPWMLYSSYFSTDDSLPTSFKWLKYISPQYYAFNAFMANEFGDRDLDCQNCGNDPNCVPCDPLDTYGIEEDELWFNIGMLAVMGVGLRIVCGFLLHYKTIKSKRT